MAVEVAQVFVVVQGVIPDLVVRLCGSVDDVRAPVREAREVDTVFM